VGARPGPSAPAREDSGDRLSTPSRLVDLAARLDARAEAKTRDWWTRYLKGAATFRGARMQAVREVAHAWFDDHGLAEAAPDERLGAVLAAARGPHTEDRLACAILLGERFVPEGWLERERDLPRLAALFDDGWLADWNVVDWFCVKALGPWVQSLDGGGPDTPRARLGRAIAGWRTAPGLWRRRASAVAFVNLVKGGDEVFEGLVDEVLASCAVLARDPERFSQTGAGWVLRELSIAEPDRVRGFLDVHGEGMSTEALRSARRKLPTV